MRRFRIGTSTYEYPSLFAALLSAGQLVNRSVTHRNEFDFLHSAIDGMMLREDGELTPSEIRNVVAALKDIEIPSDHPELRNFVETVMNEAKRIPELF